jgi:hypothetical protein
MTKEQAIKLLRKETSPMEIHLLTIEGLNKEEVTDKIQEAMNMGIDALEKQTWISVEDRLPENAERYKGRKVIDVLVTTEKGLVTKVQRQCYRDSWSWGRIFSRVVAWMPLPEPYKEG